MSHRPPPTPAPPTPAPPTTAGAAAARLARLAAAAKAWERDVVIPHCAVCTRPCCALTDVVLELSPPEAETLYRITPSSKQLPATVQASGGRFYAHGSPCPAFAVGTHRCTIYDTGRKPVACADFPVYADDDVVTADRRCEAVAAGLTALEDALVAALEPGETLAILADPAHEDVFVSFAIEVPAPKAATGTTPKAMKSARQDPPVARPAPRKRQPQGKPEPRERPPRPASASPSEPPRPAPPWRRPQAGGPPPPSTTPGRRR